jgi:hypothetical protein
MSSGTRWPPSVTCSSGAARHRGLALARALLRAALAVQHVGARHLVVAAAHQAELDLVLHVLDVEGAAARARAQQRAHHARSALDRLAHAGRRRALRAVHRQEGLHQRHRDLVRLEDTTAPLRRMIW